MNDVKEVVLAFVLPVLLAAGILIFARQAPAFDQQNFDHFLYKLNRFQRELYGCPPAGYPPAIECRGGIFDAKLWAELVADSPGVFRK